MGIPKGWIPVLVEVTEDDIRDMDYYLNECPMGNFGTKNAITVALARILNPEFHVSIVIREGEAHARFGSNQFCLGKDIGAWLESALHGASVKPAAWLVWLPEKLVPIAIRP